MELDVIFAGTIRRMCNRMPDAKPPEGATHGTLWNNDGQFVITWERTVYGKTQIWDHDKWSNTEAHYVARRLVAAGKGGMGNVEN